MGNLETEVAALRREVQTLQEQVLRGRRVQGRRRLRTAAAGLAGVALLVSGLGTAQALPGRNTVDSGDIINGQVKTRDIAGNAVRGWKVKDGSLTGRDLRNGSVDAADIADGSLGSADIADGSLASVDIANGSLTGADVANGSITSADIADGSLTGADLNANTIGGMQVDENDLGPVPSARTALNVYPVYLTKEGNGASYPRGVVTFTKSGTGTYEITFNRSIRNCYATATVGGRHSFGYISAPQNRQIAVLPGYPAEDDLYIQTADSNGALVDEGFYAVVVCGSA